MNYAKLENSQRLQALLSALSTAWQSTGDIEDEVRAKGHRTVAVGTVRSELRHNGIDVKHTQEGRIHFYRVGE